MRMSIRRPTIISPTTHIRSYSFGPFLALILTGCLLSFIAGYINTVCIASLLQASIAGFTGSTSRMTIELAQGNFIKTLHYLFMIISFVSGSFISAALVGGASFRIQRSYGVVLILESFGLAFAFLFEETASNTKGTSIPLLASACLISLTYGLQNGMCTTFSGAVIRTTHMTGILTDIGLVLGQAIFYPRTRKHIWKLKVLLPLYGTFCLGGVSGWFAYKLLLIKSMLLASAIVGILGIAHVCYCKIFLVYKSKNSSLKHWKRNKNNKLSSPEIVIHENPNNTIQIQEDGIAKDSNEAQQHEIKNTSTKQKRLKKKVTSFHNTTADTIAS
ncbi:unnamed protein product [Rotaria sordida]|uniref:DUF1275 domain-containing protein n=1 Tax=Rotaria sordida TaxID=392033 RepID=A0A814R5I3_9BILA|nr:unnamed protein product [Rotaria sordida]CAF3677025.1 unnamed protein product [Rotaria sordida]